jgi:hypothetical protein
MIRATYPKRGREGDDGDRRSDNRCGFSGARHLGSPHLLGEARELCDADDVAELLSKAEEILIAVVTELPGALPRSAGRTIRTNGGLSFGKSARVESTQAPFDYRSRDREPRER